jgi:hypothetical protein
MEIRTADFHKSYLFCLRIKHKLWLTYTQRWNTRTRGKNSLRELIFPQSMAMEEKSRSFWVNGKAGECR